MTPCGASRGVSTQCAWSVSCAGSGGRDTQPVPQVLRTRRFLRAAAGATQARDSSPHPVEARPGSPAGKAEAFPMVRGFYACGVLFGFGVVEA